MKAIVITQPGDGLCLYIYPIALGSVFLGNKKTRMKYPGFLY